MLTQSEFDFYRALLFLMAWLNNNVFNAHTFLVLCTLRYRFVFLTCGNFSYIFSLEESKKGRVWVINIGWPSEKRCAMVRIKNPIRESRDGEKGSCARLKDRGKSFFKTSTTLFKATRRNDLKTGETLTNIHRQNLKLFRSTEFRFVNSSVHAFRWNMEQIFM